MLVVILLMGSCELVGANDANVVRWVSETNYAASRIGIVGQDDCLEFGFDRGRDRDNPTTGKTGMVFSDDIRLTRPTAIANE